MLLFLTREIYVTYKRSNVEQLFTTTFIRWQNATVEYKHTKNVFFIYSTLCGSIRNIGRIHSIIHNLRDIEHLNQIQPDNKNVFPNPMGSKALIRAKKRNVPLIWYSGRYNDPP